MKFTIRKKLVGSFMLVIALLIAVSAIALTRMGGMGMKTREIDENRMPGVIILGELNGDVSDVQRLVLRSIVEKDISNMTGFESQLFKLNVKVHEQMLKYKALISDEQEKAMYNSFEKNYNSYFQQLPAIIKLTKANKDEEAIAAHASATPFWENANNSITELVRLNQQGAKKATSESFQLYSTGSMLITILSIIAVAAGIIIAVSISLVISRPLIRLNKAAEEIASGNLSSEDIVIRNKDEIGGLAASFNLMTKNLRSIIQQVGTAADQVAASSEQLTASAAQSGTSAEQVAFTMQEMAGGVESQVQNVEAANQNIQRMSSGVDQIETSAVKAFQQATDTAGKASEGESAIEKAVGQMNSIGQTVNGLGTSVRGLGARSAEIGQIIEVITGISEQTNLLALNAAIEAARAGEHGRGFAVVANEVRKLAEQTANSAQQISGLISSIQDETRQAVGTMEDAVKEVADGIGVIHTAGESFTMIKESVNEVKGQIQEVSEAVHQMAAGTRKMVSAVNEIAEAAEMSSAGTQQVASASEEQLASMEEISVSAQSLTEMADELQTLIAQFKV
ncbi:methyl-accepting chemotaxis protein [Metabacillus sp. GX 13764]|uniref:methyl-accepting chemotaxis protein n=1 Tax=Metabacillus kandeliae TaxID=2900151 RepID=UPI001E30E78F|nr:methyl-accepting chemotaxis protein [Metabacillus kandeliae]MCD7035409.1 methyl-accepting chemotaxis protein [Metabacillus kandeliae]